MKIQLTKQCQKELKQINKNQPNYAKLIVKKIQAITNGKMNHVKITAYDGLYKTRVGVFRIGYSIQEKVLIFWMIKKRGEAYNKSHLSRMQSNNQNGEW